MKKIIPILVVGIFLIGAVGAIATPQANFEHKNIAINFKQLEIKETEGVLQISLDNTNSYVMKANCPMLPKYTQSFTFPFGTDIKSVTVTKENIKQIPIEKEIIRVPEPVTAESIIKKSSEKVELTSTYPEKDFDYKVTSGLVNGVRSTVVNVVSYAVRFDPVLNIIESPEKINIDIVYDLPKDTATLDEYKFIILTADKYNSNSEILASHKNSRGLSTKVVTLSEIYGGTYFTAEGRDDQEQIKYFIKNAIENWGTSYVLLVGNRDTFPLRYTTIYMDDSDNNEFVCDLYYADIYDGTGAFDSWDSNENDLFGEYHETVADKVDEVDLHPDVYIGRLPVNSASELDSIIEKIKTYETQKAFTKDWFTNLVCIGGDSFIDDEYDPDGVYEGETVNQVVIDMMDGFIPEKIWVSLGELTTRSPLNSALNDGAGFADFSGHGNTNVYATHPHLNDNIWLPGPKGGYFDTDIMSLNNDDALPIVITGACSVSKFNKDKETFSYSWLRNANGGGIAAFGATALGYAYISSYVTYGLVEKMAIETFDAYDNGAITVGEMWGNALNSYMVNPGLESDADYKTMEEWNLFGDPTLAIAEDSEPPVKPDAPSGPTSGSANNEYTYSASTTDPEQ